MALCELCNHDHQDPSHVTCGCDYEPCDYCGFDHAYEPEEAGRWHDAHHIPDFDEGTQACYELD